MGQRKLAQIDGTTGEVMDGIVAFIPNKTRNGFGAGWVALGMNAAECLARTDMAGSDYRLLFLLLSRLDFENYIGMNQSELGRQLGMHKVTVSRSLKRLVDEGIVLVRDESPKGYRMNPHFAWRGSARQHLKALDLKLAK
jgi:biotin operon repressor